MLHATPLSVVLMNRPAARTKQETGPAVLSLRLLTSPHLIVPNIAHAASHVKLTISEGFFCLEV